MTIRFDYQAAAARGAWAMVDLNLTTGLDSGDITFFDRENGLIYALPAPSERLPIRTWKDVRPEDVAVVDETGATVKGSFTEPTVELPMHLRIYAARPEISAIVHTHAEDSQVFAAAQKDIPTATIDSYTRAGFGPIRCGKFGVVASEELGNNMVAALGERSNAALMARHGAVALGSDIDEALFTATVIEKAARQARKIMALGQEPEQLTLHHIFDPDLISEIESGTVLLDTQTVTVQRLVKDEEINMQWLTDVFHVEKPIIAMLHLGALPGDPGFDGPGGMRQIVDDARRDLGALQDGGVDGVLISNEFSLPYLTETEPITAIAMARVIGELVDEINVPFGVNVLWDGKASIDLAAATGARFVREIFTGVYASDFGLWNTNVGESARHRRRMGASDVRLMFNVVPEATTYLGVRDLGAITRSTVFNAKPDALVVSGLTAGAATDNSALATVRNNSGDVPVLVNTGMNVRSAATQLSIADGAVVGTAFKKDGKFENRVDKAEVEQLMAVVRDIRLS